MIGTSLLFSGSIAGLLTPFDSVAPTAGYSLRNLGLSYSGAVVRVRKDITGNPEQDFTASQITNGTLSNFLETLGTDAHSQSVSTQFEDLSDVSLICDCNSGGTDELDAFDALYENGFVSKWYDQFGSNDATQTTATDQPKIWDASTGLVTENGKPAIEFDGVNDSLATPDYIVELSQNNATVLSVTKALDSRYIMSEADVESPYSSNFILGNSNGNSVLWVNTTQFGAQPPTTQALLGFTYDGTNFQAYLNGSTSGSAGTATVNTEVLNQTVIGARADQTSSFYSGKIQELITYKSDQSANRTAIESNINGYYDIWESVYFQGVEYRVVYNPVTGRYWLDRNLGASQVATSFDDSNAYGDLYQWGRYAEGHQLRSSSTTTTLATTEVPNDGNTWDGDFITTSASPDDWLATPDNNLWQGVSGVNIPAPEGFRLPTEAEWEAERASWSSNDRAGAFASPLKLPSAGYRFYDDGSVFVAGSIGHYWSSTVDGSYARRLFFSSSSAGVGGLRRALGFSVRLIKDES